jgi:hypothetical protein
MLNGVDEQELQRTLRSGCQIDKALGDLVPTKKIAKADFLVAAHLRQNFSIDYGGMVID